MTKIGIQMVDLEQFFQNDYILWYQNKLFDEIKTFSEWPLPWYRVPTASCESN